MSTAYHPLWLTMLAGAGQIDVVQKTYVLQKANVVNSLVKQKGLILYLQNVRSINNKLSYLRSKIDLLTVLPGIIIFTETWLKPEMRS